jgi:chromosome segregation ATPase
MAQHESQHKDMDHDASNHLRDLQQQLTHIEEENNRLMDGERNALRQVTQLKAELAAKEKLWAAERTKLEKRLLDTVATTGRRSPPAAGDDISPRQRAGGAPSRRTISGHGDDGGNWLEEKRSLDNNMRDIQHQLSQREREWELERLKLQNKIHELEQEVHQRSSIDNYELEELREEVPRLEALLKRALSQQAQVPAPSTTATNVPAPSARGRDRQVRRSDRRGTSKRRDDDDNNNNEHNIDIDNDNKAAETARELQKQRTSLADHVRRLNDDVRTTSLKLQQLNDQLATNEGQLSERRNELITLDKQVTEQRTALRTTTAQVDAATLAHNAAVTTRQRQWDQDDEDYRRRMEARTRDEQVAATDEETRRFVVERAQWNVEREQAQRAKKQADDERARYREEKTSLEATLLRLEQEIGIKQRLIDEKTREMEEADSVATRHTARIKRITDDQKEMERKLDDTKRDLKQRHDELRILDRQVEQRREENDLLRKRIDHEQTMKVRDMNDQVTDLESRSKTAGIELRRAIDDTKREHEIVRKLQTEQKELERQLRDNRLTVFFIRHSYCNMTDSLMCWYVGINSWSERKRKRKNG